MCCFTEQGVECEYRVILHSNRVYPIQGRHSHPVENQNVVSSINIVEDELKKCMNFKEDIKQRLQNALLKKKKKN